jgi:hypothetical protein
MDDTAREGVTGSTTIYWFVSDVWMKQKPCGSGQDGGEDRE